MVSLCCTDSCHFRIWFQDEQYWQYFPSPLVTVLLAVDDDRVVTDVLSSCSDDFIRSEMTELTSMAVMISRHISQTF